MKRAWALGLSFVSPLIVGGAVLTALLIDGNEDAEGWLRAAAFTVIPAALANGLAAWIVALRPRASPPSGGFGVLLRAFATFALAVPLLWVAAIAVIWLTGDTLGTSTLAGSAVAIYAAIMGLLPMTMLQWLTYHFTLDRKTA